MEDKQRIGRQIMTKLLQTRLDDMAWDWLQRMAVMEHVTVTEANRIAIREAAERRGLLESVLEGGNE